MGVVGQLVCIAADAVLLNCRHLRQLGYLGATILAANVRETA